MYMHIVVHVVGMYVYIVSRMNTVHHRVNRMCVCESDTNIQFAGRL